MPRPGLTLGELRNIVNDELKDFDDDLPVHFVYDYGDMCHTQIAPIVRSVTMGILEKTSYPFQTLKLSNSDNEGDEDGDSAIKAIIIQ